MDPKSTNRGSSMTDRILHVRARCGAGKSRETIKEMINYLLRQQSVEDLYLFASTTNSLTGQNYAYVQEVVQNHVNGKGLQITKIDSDTNKGTVIRDLATLLTNGFKGVVFISHSALAMTPPKLLKGARIVVDEVPTQLVGYLIVKHSTKDSGDRWEDYLATLPSNHSSYMRVRLNPNADKDDVRRYIDDIKQKRNTAVSPKVANLLEFLLADYEALYSHKRNSHDGVTQFYHAVHYDQIKALLVEVDFFAILSAQLKSTMLGFIIEHHLGYQVEEKDINDKVTLLQKHNNRARIIPFLKEGKWSSSLRKKLAKEALTLHHQPVRCNEEVRILAQKFAADLIGQKDAVITLNQGDKLIDDLSHLKDFLTSTKVNGMNHLKHLDHAIYLASTNPKPIEFNSATLFSRDHGLDEDQLTQAIRIESCYETAYQCVARTSIREQQASPEKEHIIVVPDMHYAEYIKSWFEPGCATIDTQNSYTTTNQTKQKQDKERRLNIIINIRTEKQRGQMAALLHTCVRVHSSSLLSILQKGLE
jgi:hypothetical protein